MALGPGSRVGPYEIVAAIGAGGMGEVYRARDTRLHREVAIKVLHGLVTSDPERLARFEQEARATAALNHPNILAVYDLGQHDGAPYIVSELLDGQSVRATLAEGPMPPRKAIELGVQIAQGLAAAHEKGIVHRDLKPDNIFITADGRAKILDFGLAKLTQPDAAAGMTVLPTTPAFTAMPNTIAGVVMGTLGYMSPEQVRGAAADHRSDIFALGVVLHEMLSGQRAFPGDTAADIMSGILREDPPELPLTQRNIPQPLARIVNRCLEKHPGARFQSARDLAFALEALTSPSTATQSVALPAEPRPRGVSLPLAVAIAVLLAGVAAAAMWWMGVRSSAVAPGAARFSIALAAEDAIMDPQGTRDFAISHDGTMAAYVAVHDGTRQLYLRPIASAVGAPLSGTEGASSPFFSPGGESIAFFSAGKLRVLTITSAAIRAVADASYSRGGSWADDGFIYFAPTNNTGISKVPASGGAAAAVTTLARDRGEISHRYPNVLPGSRAMLVSVWTGPGRDNHRIELVDLATGQRKTVVQGGDAPQYVPTGHIVYARLDALMVVPFDGQSVTGPPVRTGDAVTVGGEGADFMVSDTGTLLHLAGDVHRFDTRVVWVDRTGKIEAVPVAPLDLLNAEISPDGHRAAFNLRGATEDIAIIDLDRGTVSPLTTGTDGSQSPVWSPDGRRVVYRGTRAGYRNLFWRSTDGTSGEMRLTTSDHLQTPTSWSRDGKLLLFNDSDPRAAGGGGDILVLSITDGTVTPVVKSDLLDEAGQWSPDQRWIAYDSQQGGRQEVFVQPYPATGQRWQISTAGGSEPLWSPDGQELFYRARDRVMAVDIRATGGFSAGAPRPLFADEFVRNSNGNIGYSLSPDGRRFLFLQRVQPQSARRQIDVVLNWFTGLAGSR